MFVLECCGQRDVAVDILRWSASISSETLGSYSPVTATLGFMVDIASRVSEYDHAKLESIYQESVAQWGKTAPSTLTARYHIAWQLALRPTMAYEAWNVLEPLIDDCQKSLGHSHVQTVTCRATSARVLFHMGKNDEAARVMRSTVETLYSTYGKTHPCYLEARARHAIFLTKLGPAYDPGGEFYSVAVEQTGILGLENKKTKSTARVLGGLT